MWVGLTKHRKWMVSPNNYNRDNGRRLAFTSNIHPLEIVSRYRDPQLQEGK